MTCRALVTCYTMQALPARINSCSPAKTHSHVTSRWPRKLALCFYLSLDRPREQKSEVRRSGLNALPDGETDTFNDIQSQIA